MGDRAHEVLVIFEELRNLLRKRRARGYTLAYTFRSLLFIFLYDCVRFVPTPVGEFARYAVLKLFCRRIESLWIRAGTAFFFPEHISIGRRVSINDNVFINGYGGVEIGDDCAIAFGTAILSEDHETGNLELPIRDQPKIPGRIRIEDDVWIAANCTILRGVTIGRGSVIGAGSVVTRSVPPFSVAAGNPARVLRARGEGRREVREPVRSGGKAYEA